MTIMGLVTDWNVKETWFYSPFVSMHRWYSVIHSVQSDIVHVHCWKEEKHTHAHTHIPKNLNVVLNIGSSKEIVFSFHFFSCWTQGAGLKCELLLVNTQQGSFSQQRLFQSLIIFLTSSSNLLNETPLAEHHCPIPWLNSMEIKSFFCSLVFKKRFHSKAD